MISNELYQKMSIALCSKYFNETYNRQKCGIAYTVRHKQILLRLIGRMNPTHRLRLLARNSSRKLSVQQIRITIGVRTNRRRLSSRKIIITLLISAIARVYTRVLFPRDPNKY